MSDEKQIIKGEEPRQTTSVSMGGEILTSLMDAVKDPSLDADKLEKMMNMQLALLNRQQEQEFNRDKIAAIMEMPSITKRGSVINHKTGKLQSRYSRWEDIHRAITPILRKYNMVLTHIIDTENNFITVQPVLSHANGYVEKGGSMRVPTDTTGSKNDTQGVGSASTYGQRYTTIKFLNIVEDGQDDDGQGGKIEHVTLSVDEKALLAEAEDVAERGPVEYQDWFKSKPATHRGWLVDNGHHETLKRKAVS